MEFYRRLGAILGALAFLIPGMAFASIATPWNATSTDKGYVSPTLINGWAPWLHITSTGTSTFSNGIDLSGGCFSIGGVCITGGGGSGTVTQINTTYPILGGPITTTGTLSLAFGTTTTNIWSNLQTFTSGFISQASSTIGNGTQKGGLTVSGGATTTGSLAVQGTATSTFGGDIRLTSGGGHIVAHGAQGDGSDGFHIDSNAVGGTQVCNFGAAGTANVSCYGGFNIDGTLRIGTGVNGLLKATAGSVSAASAGTDYVAPATTLTIAGTANQISSSAGAQDLSTNRTWTLSLPNHIIFPSSFQVTNSTTTNATTTGSVYLTGLTGATGGLAIDGNNRVYKGATTTAGTGLTYSGNAFNVNTSQNIATLSNLTTNGFVTTSGGVGTLGVQAFPVTVAQGGTNATSFSSNNILYTDSAGTTFKGTATSTLMGPATAGQVWGYNSNGTWSAQATTTFAAGTGISLSTAGNQITITNTGSAGSAFPFTPDTYGALAVNATSTPLWLKYSAGQYGLIASSTFVTYASSTVASVSGSFYIASHRIIDDALGGLAFQPTIGTTALNIDANTLWINGSSGTGVFNVLTSGNLTRFGLGTSTPRWQLQIASSTGPQLALSDGSISSNHWTFQNMNGNFYLATASPATYATSTIPAFSIIKGGIAGLVGLGSTSPAATLGVTGSGFFSSFLRIMGNFIVSAGALIGLGGEPVATQGITVATSTVFAATQFGGSYASSSAQSAVYNIDWEQGNTQRIILNQATTINFNATSSHPRDGFSYKLKLCQDGTGGRAISYVNLGQIGWAYGTTSIGTVANTGIMLGMVYDARALRYDVVASSTLPTQSCVP